MADISPELAEKIRELSARHEENPGRFFVPLANALRDAGEIGQAEELLRSGLKRHPGYLSAHIVLGRCLADRGAQEEAALEFRHVLSVDPQNLIALRTMGEMTAASGRPDEAARWYRELLAVDPMNKEARDALDAVEASGGGTPAASAPAPEPQAGYGDLGADFGLVDVDTGAGPAPSHEPEPDHAEFGMVDPGAFSIGDSTPPASADAAPEFGVVDLDAPALHVDSTAGASPEFQAFGDDGFGADALGATPGGDASSQPAPVEPASDEPAAPPVDFGSWGEVALEPGAEAGEAKAEDRMREYDDFSFGGVELGAPAASSAPPPAADLPVGPALELGGFAEPAHEDDEEVVTETMAELYARQGFHDRAIDVYRELLRRRGDEPALVRRLAELETLAGREAAQGGASAIIEVPPVTPADLHGDADLPVIETGLPGLNFTGGLPYEPASDDATLPFGSSVPPLEGLTFETPGTDLPLSDAGVDDAAPQGLQPFDDFAADPDAFAAPAPGFDPVPSADAPPAAEQGDADAGWDAGPSAGEPAATETAAAGQDASPAPAVALTGDGFADSFAYGFGDGAPAAAPSGTEPAAAAASAEPPSAEAFAASPSSEAVSAPESAPAPTAAETEATTVAGYFAALLAWRPGQAKAAEQATASAAQPAEPPAAALDPEVPVEEVASFDLPSAQAPAAETPPVDAPAAEEPSPWDAPTPAAERPEQPAAASGDDLPWLSADDEPAQHAAEAPAAPAEEPAPWDAAPWDAPAAEAAAPETPADARPEPFEVSSLGFDLPAPAAGEPTVQPPAPEEAAEALPWELGSADAPPAPAPVPEAPRQAPAPVEGGFSFEDFFSAPVPEPEPAPTLPPVPAPEAPAAPGADAAAPQPGGEDDEDLESFQAWLQSLKR